MEKPLSRVRIEIEVVDNDGLQHVRTIHLTPEQLKGLNAGGAQSWPIGGVLVLQIAAAT